ncbi:helix-turn-helix transcriptional regulator [Bengtsoniella intestinalis]|uniref:PadR family transcriptional regulator n=1 Tax=Bengtsoniella intestinalis TaxID=3073143 RepID=UPI00391F42A0
MAREKFQTLTEQMFYILLCLQEERWGSEIMTHVQTLTDGRITIGPGTLYNLLEQFVTANMIVQTKTEGRKRCYLITQTGLDALDNEYQRLTTLTQHYQHLRMGKDTP